MQLKSLGDLDSSVGILLQVKCGIWMDNTSNFHIEFVDSNWIMIFAATAYKLERSNLAVGIWHLVWFVMVMDSMVFWERENQHGVANKCKSKFEDWSLLCFECASPSPTTTSTTTISNGVGVIYWVRWCRKQGLYFIHLMNHRVKVCFLFFKGFCFFLFGVGFDHMFMMNHDKLSSSVVQYFCTVQRIFPIQHCFLNLIWIKINNNSDSCNNKISEGDLLLIEFRY